MRTLKLFLFLPLVLLLQACPVGLDYSMAEGNMVKIDPQLIGKWMSDRPDGEIVSVEFKAMNATSLRAKVLESGDSYAVEGYDYTVWQTEIGVKKFLVFKSDATGQFYHYCFEIVDGKVVFHDVALLDGGVDAVTSTSSLRDQVARSIVMDGWGEEITTLTRM